MAQVVGDGARHFADGREALGFQEIGLGLLDLAAHGVHGVAETADFGSSGGGEGRLVIAGADGADSDDQFFKWRGEQASDADGQQSAYREGSMTPMISMVWLRRICPSCRARIDLSRIRSTEMEVSAESWMRSRRYCSPPTVMSDRRFTVDGDARMLAREASPSGVRELLMMRLRRVEGDFSVDGLRDLLCDRMADFSADDDIAEDVAGFAGAEVDGLRCDFV